MAPTTIRPDGSGVRDYIHVMDVAEAHCVALEHLHEGTGLRAFNLGTGLGISVLQLIAAFQEVSGVDIPMKIVGRQPGDVATLIADPSRMEKAWGWRTTRDLQTCAVTRGASRACTQTGMRHRKTH